MNFIHLAPPVQGKVTEKFAKLIDKYYSLLAGFSQSASVNEMNEQQHLFANSSLFASILKDNTSSSNPRVPLENFEDFSNSQS